MNSGEEVIHGKAWVKDGQIQVQNPGPGGKPAVIVPCPNVEILVSGRKITQPEPLAETTPVQVHFSDEQPTVSYQVQIGQGGLEAQVTMFMRDGLKHSLADCPPTESLLIQYTTSPVKASPTVENLLEAMKEKGVVHGVDMDACNKACANPTSVAFVAARGEPFIPGRDGEIQFLVPMERVVDLPADELQIDFRETVKLPDVKAGQVIAIKREPVPGTPGKSVTGAVLPPPKCKDPHFRAGKGVEIKTEKEGVQSAVATVAGCPMFAEESGVISVENILTCKGDVNLSSGNLRSSGSINVYGHVHEGMKVECEGNQEISGTVTGATLKAWGSIIVRGNVFKSTVTAGKDSSWVRTMDGLFADIDEAATGVLAAEEQLRDVLARKESGQMTESDALLLNDESHVERFRRLVLALAALYKENLMLFPKEIADQVRGTRDLLSGFGTGVFDKTRAIVAGLNDARTWIAMELMKGKSDVAVPYVQSSTIEASRDIIVSGQGAFYATLIAGRAIKVSGSPGLVRGGEAKARELIQVNTAGGQGAAPTLLTVPPEGKIQGQTILPNTVLKVGPLSFRTENTLQAVKASLQNGRLVVVTATGSIEVQ
ncbi:MAG: DUF342 domain-containing protein [Bacillota bacterium]